MARDINLAFVTSATEFATTGVKGSVVQCEGGFYALVRLLMGTLTGSSALVSIAVQASIDEGSNYYHIGEFPILDEDDDNIEIARPVYIPKPTTAGTKVRVRLNVITAGGTVTLFPVNYAFLEPLLDPAASGIDSDLASGVAKLV